MRSRPHRNRAEAAALARPDRRWLWAIPALGVAVLVAVGLAADRAAAVSACSGSTQTTGGFTIIDFGDPSAGTCSWTVPANVHQLRFDAFGADGGSSQGTADGGLGGQASATLTVAPGTTYLLTVGGAGGDATSSPGAGGANGGGAGGTGDWAGGGGGGASDIRFGGAGLADRILVGGGGGGAAVGAHGGAGGGTAGGDGCCHFFQGTGRDGGTGGTQTGPGSGGVSGTGDDCSPGNDGAPGDGGDGADHSLIASTVDYAGGGGGGGGYWGGGGGGGSEGTDCSVSGSVCCTIGAGGGGSGFVNILLAGLIASDLTQGVGAANSRNGLIRVTYDSTPPTTTIALSPTTPNGENGWYVSAVSVLVSAADNTGGSGVAETRCTLDPGSPPAAFGRSPAACTFLSPGASVGTDGTHTVYGASKDVTGNEETPVSKAFKIDQTDPQTSASATTPGPQPYVFGTWTSQNVTVTLTASDTPSGVDKTYDSVDDPDCGSGGPPPALGDCQLYTVPFTISDEAAHTVRYFTKDLAGNFEAVQAALVQIDQTPPVTTLMLDPAVPDVNGWYVFAVKPTVERDRHGGPGAPRRAASLDPAERAGDVRRPADGHRARTWHPAST